MSCLINKIINVDDNNLAALLANKDVWVSWNWYIFKSNKEALKLLIPKTWRLFETVESLK